MIDLSTHIGPYFGIAMDEIRSLADGQRFRLAIYGCYNQNGLYGSEHNGIVIFDEQQKTIVCDKIACMTSGYYGPDKTQIAIFGLLLHNSDEDFVRYVNGHKQCRLPIDYKRPVPVEALYERAAA